MLEIGEKPGRILLTADGVWIIGEVRQPLGPATNSARFVETIFHFFSPVDNHAIVASGGFAINTVTATRFLGFESSCHTINSAHSDIIGERETFLRVLIGLVKLTYLKSVLEVADQQILQFPLSCLTQMA